MISPWGVLALHSSQACNGMSTTIGNVFELILRFLSLVSVLIILKFQWISCMILVAVVILLSDMITFYVRVTQHLASGNNL